jgi:hypothetical protein
MKTLWLDGRLPQYLHLAVRTSAAAQVQAPHRVEAMSQLLDGCDPSRARNLKFPSFLQTFIADSAHIAFKLLRYIPLGEALTCKYSTASLHHSGDSSHTNTIRNLSDTVC